MNSNKRRVAMRDQKNGERFMVTVNGREVAAGVDVFIHFNDHQSRPVTQVGFFSRDGRPWVGYDHRELLYPVIDWCEIPEWSALSAALKRESEWERVYGQATKGEQ
jgi:hypothetical protein